MNSECSYFGAVFCVFQCLRDYFFFVSWGKQERSGLRAIENSETFIDFDLSSTAELKQEKTPKGT